MHAVDSPQGAGGLSSRRPRWLQVSLRLFLLLLTLVSVGLGLVVNKAHQQKSAIDRIRALEGSVVFDYQCGITSPYLRDAAPPGPAWLRQMAPPEYFNRVTVVNLIRSPISDQDFEAFQHLPDVQAINISECENVTGRGFQHLRELHELKRLYVHATPIQDEGVKQAAQLRQLDWLMLRGAFTDQGMEHLRAMDWLSELQVGSGQIGRHWKEELRKSLPHCKVAVGWTMY